MGSGSSRLGSRPSRGRVNRTNCFSRLSSLLNCGGSSSRAPLEMDDYPAEIWVNSTEHCVPVVNTVQNLQEEPCSISSSRTGFTGTSTESTEASSGSVGAATEGTSFEDNSRNVETNNGKGLTESKDLVSFAQISAACSHGESLRDSSASASTSFKEQRSSESVSESALANGNAVSGINNSENKGVSETYSGSSCLPPQVLADSHSDGSLVQDPMGEATRIHHSDPASHVTDLPVTFHSLGGETIPEAIPSGLGFLVSNREQGRGDASVLHVDVVSISSNILSSDNVDTSAPEARRNSRRLFWDAFSRRSSRRLSDSPTILFSTNDNDDLGSHDRWLLDFSGEFFDDWARGDSGYMGSRIHSLNEQRRHSRSEIWERLRGGRGENGQQTTFCPSGVHPIGTCLCDSLLMTDESSARASISRIVMLAEALFEVLDEIHRQPVSLSLSMVSLPAPESVVDSFPLKSYKKVDATDSGDGVEQCYICLAEYEEGDKIRVLPCHHEYHMSCVDKWLKEIHGVCPLCRGDVRQGATGLSVSNPEIPSL